MFNEYDVFFDKTNNCYQVRTKASSYVLEFDNDGKKEIFERMVSSKQNDVPTLFEQLKKEFDTDQVIDVFSTLSDFSLLPAAEVCTIPEMASTNNGNGQAQGQGGTGGWAPLEEKNILVLGDGKIAASIKKILKRNEIKTVNILSNDLFLEFTDQQVDEAIIKADFCFVDASEWNPAALERINVAALKHNTPWLHIGGMEEYTMKIGPLFLGDETGCYDCFVSRIKSNHDYPEYFTSYESHLRKHKKTSKPDDFLYLETYGDILANFAFLELSKFFQMWAVPRCWKRLVTINAVTFETHTHDLLKVPFCPTCNQNHVFHPSPWLEPISIHKS